eukprot:4183214-Prymnesium_polylepis.1
MSCLGRHGVILIEQGTKGAHILLILARQSIPHIFQYLAVLPGPSPCCFPYFDRRPPPAPRAPPLGW